MDDYLETLRTLGVRGRIQPPNPVMVEQNLGVVRSLLESGHPTVPQRLDLKPYQHAHGLPEIPVSKIIWNSKLSAGCLGIVRVDRDTGTKPYKYFVPDVKRAQAYVSALG